VGLGLLGKALHREFPPGGSRFHGLCEASPQPKCGKMQYAHGLQADQARSTGRSSRLEAQDDALREGPLPAGHSSEGAAPAALRPSVRLYRCGLRGSAEIQ